MSKEVELIIEGKSYKMPVVEGTEKEMAIDISSLRAQTGYITLDIGYKNTGATQSAITFLDGEAGILRYRGYPIEELAEHASFTEVAYLLIYGKMPEKAELDRFNKDLSENAGVPEPILAMVKAFPREAHPMGVMASLVSALTAFYPEALEPTAPESVVNETMIKLMAKLPTLAAAFYRHSEGKAFTGPKMGMDYCENFLHMMFGDEGAHYEAKPSVVKALHNLLILHADHEQNCSTSTVRIVGSSQASLYSSVSAGISALWGPLHGGANQEVIEMLEAIKSDGGDTKKYLAKAKDKNDAFRLMGFGHRVYKNFDPRARIIKVACDQVLANLGINDPVLTIAKGLEEEALSDQYFVDRKLYPNVDFYSGIIYRALGIRTDFFTVMFAIGRLPGWTAQWKERKDANEAIGRPRQVYIGETERHLNAVKA
jgi:citrate synthase